MSIFGSDDQPDYFRDSGPEETADNNSNVIDFGSEQDTGSTSSPDSNDGKPRHRSRLKWVITGVLTVMTALGVTLWLRYFTPYVEDARMNIYVVNVERRGLIFKTYEAEVISQSALTDTARIYTRQLDMSIEDPRLAGELQAVQSTGKPITVSYKKYYGMLPWRGSSTEIITGIVKK